VSDLFRRAAHIASTIIRSHSRPHAALTVDSNRGEVKCGEFRLLLFHFCLRSELIEIFRFLTQIFVKQCTMDEPSELSIREIHKYFVRNNYKVTNTQLVKYFRKYLTGSRVGESSMYF
jgi:hypothetical protein